MPTGDAFYAGSARADRIYLGSTLIHTAAEPAVVIAADSFTRVDNASSLGTADTGQVWAYPSVTKPFALTSNAAVPQPGTGGRRFAVIDAGVADCTIEVKMATYADASAGIVARLTDTSNFYRFQNSRGYKAATAGGAFQAIGAGSAAYSATFVAGDTMRVVMAGDTFTVQRQTGSTGAFVTVWTGSDAHNNTATRHGIQSSDVAGATSFDDFKITENA